MADNDLDIVLRVRTSDDAEQVITRTLSSIQKAAESQGRKIGESTSKGVASGITSTSPKKAIEENLISSIKASTGVARKAVQEAYNQIFKVDSIVQSASTKKVIDEALINPIKQAKGQARKEMQAFYDELFKAIPKKQADLSNAANMGMVGPQFKSVFEQLKVPDPTQSIERLGKLKKAIIETRQMARDGVIPWDVANAKVEGFLRNINVLESGNARARSSFHKATAALASFTFEMTGAIYGLTALGAVFGAPAFLGGAFLKTLEDSRVGIAGIVASMTTLEGNDLTVAQSMSVADQQIKEITKSAHKYGLAVDEVVDAYRAMLGNGLSVGMSLQEIGKIAVVGTLAVKAFGLNAQQTRQELRDLVTPGGITSASSTIATALGITNDKLKELAKESRKTKGDTSEFFNFLEDKFKGLANVAIAARMDTVSGLLDSIKIKMQMAFADEKLYSGFKDFLRLISDSLGYIDEQGTVVLSKDFKEVADAYSNLANSVLGFAKIFVESINLAVTGVSKLDNLTDGAFSKFVIGAAGAVTAFKLIPKAAQIEMAATYPIMEKGGALLAAAMRNGFILGITGLISYTMTKELIDSSPVAKKFATWLFVGGMAIIEGAKNLWRSTLNEIQYMYEAVVEKVLSGIHTTIGGLKKGAEIVGLKDTSENLGVAQSVFAPPSISAEQRYKARQFNIDAASKKEFATLRSYYKDIVQETESGEKRRAALTNPVEIEKLKSRNAAATREQQLKELEKGLKTKEYLEREHLDSIQNIKSLYDDQIAYKKQMMHSSDLKESESYAKEIVDLEKRKSAALAKEREDYQKKLSSGGKTQITKNYQAAKDTLESKLKLEDIELKKTQNKLEIDAITNSKSSEQVELEKYAALMNTFNAKESLLEQAKKDEKLVKDKVVLDKIENDLKEISAKRTAAVVEEEKRLTEVKMRNLTLIQDSKNAMSDEQNSYDLARESIGKTTEEVAKLNLEMQRRKELRDKFTTVDAQGNVIQKPMNADVKAQMQAEIDLKYQLKEADIEYQNSFVGGWEKAFDDYYKAAFDTASQAKSAFQSMAKHMEDAIVQFVTTGKISFSGFAKAVLSELLRIQAAKMAAMAMSGTSSILGTILNIGASYFAGTSTGGSAPGYSTGDLGGGIGSGGGAVGFGGQSVSLNQALGGAWEGGVKKFAMGGAFTNSIVSSPTLFPFAKGVGLMGEAGPEAIMPLTRTPSGHLGVRSQGGEGGVNVNVQVTINQDGSTNTQVSGQNGKELGQLISAAVVAEIIKQKRNNGLLDNNRRG